MQGHGELDARDPRCRERRRDPRRDLERVSRCLRRLPRSGRLLTYHGRYAPSPTGPLHLGNAFCAVVAWHRARAAQGRFSLRIEDLDRARTIAGMAEEHARDLAWLGLDWDGEPVVQSARTALYDEAVEQLIGRGLAYYCTCSRKSLAVASAPHGLDDEPPPYPGICRGRRDKPDGRYSVRFLVRPGVVRFHDALAGDYEQDVEKTVGDFVIARADGTQLKQTIAYQLAVVVDDLAMGITEVVRGRDLLTSTPRQLLLYEALGRAPPRFAHTALVLAEDGTKLSKRNPQHTIAGLHAAGVDPRLLRERMLALSESERPSFGIEALV